MSTVIATSVLPDSTANDTLTIGATGDSVVISGDSLNLNTLQDAGGNTIFVSNGSGSITSTGFPGAMKFISTTTASSATEADFTLDSTYDVYYFRFIDINPGTSGGYLGFNGSTDSGSNYNTTKTTTLFRAQHGEGGAARDLVYATGWDLAQSTARQPISMGITNDADGCAAGELYLFGPSSTTYIKNFYSHFQLMNSNDPKESIDVFVAGYLNTASAVDSVRFDMQTGNFDGIITMYGISKS